MTALVALAIGYLLGGLPTADLLARAVRVDLRSAGSGNPGTANALRLGGRRLAAAILAVELVKGAGAVMVGRALGGDPAGLASGAGAVIGNILNPWYRFRGGKGLGITAGVTLAVWPVAVLPAGLLVWALARVTGSNAHAAVLGLLAYLAGAGLWGLLQLPNWWGIEPGASLMIFALALVVIVTPKLIRTPAANPAGLGEDGEGPR